MLPSNLDIKKVIQLKHKIHFPVMQNSFKYTNTRLKLLKRKDKKDKKIRRGSKALLRYDKNLKYCSSDIYGSVVKRLVRCRGSSEGRRVVYRV